MDLPQIDEQAMAQFRALLGELSNDDIVDSQDLRALALGATGHHSDDPIDAIDSVELIKEGPLPGDFLVRRAPAEGVEYLAVIVGDYVGAADAFAARGITVESAGPGLFVEVAEVPFGGGAVSFSARRITDSWGRDPRGQTIHRPRRAGSARVDDDGDDLFESEELARHAGDGSTTTVVGSHIAPRPTILRSAQLRQAWAPYACAEERMTPLRLFERWNTLVNPEAVDAWREFERTLLAADYQPHRAWVYTCRQIAGQHTRSLHAYGLAIDIDHKEPPCNVNRPTPDGRAVRFSTAATKDERCHDVRRGVADTSFTPEQVGAVEAIQTVDGHQVFAWGGRWRTTKDTMHFQINVTPTELGRGIRLDTVRGGMDRTPAGTPDTKQKLSNIQKAKSEGLIDEANAQRQSATALSEQNMSTGSQPFIDTPPITNALQTAGSTRQPIEVSRQGQEGTKTVKVGSFLGGADLIPASFTSGGPTKAGTKLPSRAGSQAPQAWENLAPISPRTPATSPDGLKNLGTLLFVHDAETDIDLRDYGGYTDATAWMLVHTVSDLVEGLRAHVGNSGYVTGIHIEAHGGWSGQGGFRMGDDTDGDGHVESGEANDMVSSAAHAAKFGAIIKNALGPGGTSFVSVAACSSSGPNGAFIKALHAATEGITIGSVDSCRSGGNWFHRAWWEAEKGRSQINVDGTPRVDTRDDGTGIWRPF